MARRQLIRALVLGGLLCAALHAAAEGYPSRPIRFIAPFPPGGSSDVLCRLLGQKLSELEGQPVVVENKPGASSNIGHEYAARQPADGYTLLLSSSALAINPLLFTRTGFDPHGDFAPVSVVGSAGLVLAVHPSVPAASVKELIALARAKPGQLHFGSGGKGIPSHLAGEMFKVATGTDLVHVPYKGGVLAVSDAVSGQVQMVFGDMAPTIPHIRGGRLRPLAVTMAQRSPALPEVPTFDEAGVPGMRTGPWWAVVVPKATPAEIIARLNADFGRIVRSPDVVERYASLGIVPEHGTPQELTERIRADSAEYARLFKAAGIQPD